MPTRCLRRLGLPALLAVTAVALPACSGSGTTATTSSASIPGAVSSPAPAATSPAPTPSTAASTAPTRSPVPSDSAARGGSTVLPSVAAPSLSTGYLGPATARPTPGTPTTSAGCGAGQLSLAQTAGQGAAGSVIRTYALRNTGIGTCVLYGFPGASLVDAQGRQVGAAARRQGAAGGQVRLAPGQAASFDVALAYAGCPSGAPRSQSLRVYPPGDRGSLLTPYQLPVCTTPTVTAVRASG